MVVVRQRRRLRGCNVRGSLQTLNFAAQKPWHSDCAAVVVVVMSSVVVSGMVTSVVVSRTVVSVVVSAVVSVLESVISSVGAVVVVSSAGVVSSAVVVSDVGSSDVHGSDESTGIVGAIESDLDVPLHVL